jgi:GT2 family glycosyltransferase
VIPLSDPVRPAPRPPVGSIAVVVVSHNTRDLLEACLRSLLDERPSAVVVVDNASTDGSVDAILGHPDVVLRSNAVNVGYGAAANQGVAACVEPYVVLLNADTWVRPGALAALGAELDEHERAAVVAPRLVNGDGTVQGSCFPFPSPFDTALRSRR